MNLKKWSLILPFLVGASAMEAQTLDSLQMNLNLKTRGEFNHGYVNLIPDGQNPTTSVLSRARLGMNAYFDQLELAFAIQDAGIWGNRTSINKNGNVDFFEAWAKYHFSPKAYLKIGRQVLSYDNERLVGETDWAMQGRSFDAAKLGLQLNEQSQLEVVVSYNNDGKNQFDENGNLLYSYLDGAERTKSMQLVHFKTQGAETRFSAIAMNNVVQTEAGKHHAMTTVGANFGHKLSDKFNWSAYAYYQFGKNTYDQKKSAYDLSLDLNYKASSTWNLNLGGEILSGTKFDEDADRNHSFSPLYGTNHKFNGFMDYFFSGNHFNSSGLNDLYLKNNFNFSKFGKLAVDFHYFSSHQKWASGVDNYLGTEIDLVYSKNLMPQLGFNFGYSQFFASSDLKDLKHVPTAKDYQSFIWMGLSFNPNFKLK